jgi:hypothetical protein
MTQRTAAIKSVMIDSAEGQQRGAEGPADEPVTSPLPLREFRRGEPVRSRIWVAAITVKPVKKTTSTTPPSLFSR